MLTVTAYNTPSYGREIQLVTLDGQRIRIDRHPPMPIDGAWSPDGTRIAFSGGEGPSYALGFRNIYTADSGGTNVRLLYAAPTDEDHSSFAFVPSWSPDGKWVAFSVDGLGPWIVGADGREARRVANLAIEGWIAWSPDGRTLAFSGRLLDERSYANDGVYAVRVDGTRLRRITRNQTRRERASEAGIADVSWGPDGKRIAFTRYLSGPVEDIEVVNTDGHNERRVARGVCPVWSPDGRRLTFVAEDRTGGTVGISVVRPSNGPPRLIAKRKGAWCPVWTADGHRIVFFVGARRPYLAGADDGRLRKPSAAERRYVRLAPTASQFWSTDGKLLVGQGDFDKNRYVVRVLTLHGTSATFRWSDDHAPAWSPDGQKLAFVRLQKTEQIFVLNTVGNHVRRLTAGTHPAWSPDGNWIAFERKDRIFVVPSSGGSAQLIGTGSYPAWSPDSQWVAAAGAGLFVMPREQGAPRRLDQPGQNCTGRPVPEQRVGGHAWSHDGRALAFTYWVDVCQDETNLAVVTSDGTSQRFVAQGGSPEWSPDDAHIAFIDDFQHLLYISALGDAALVLVARPIRWFSLAPDGRLVAYIVDVPRGTGIWLVQTDGSDRRPLLQGGSDSDPVWRP